MELHLRYVRYVGNMISFAQKVKEKYLDETK